MNFNARPNDDPAQFIQLFLCTSVSPRFIGSFILVLWLHLRRVNAEDQR